VSGSAEPLPPGLARGLLRVDDPLRAARYREGLAALGVAAPERACFHVDAAGYSPELADDLDDPFYLGAAPLEPRALLIGPEQLAAPLVHPGFGFAREGYRRFVQSGAREIAALTLREPLLVELAPEGAPLSKPAELADPAVFEIRLRTPSDRIAGVRRLETMKREFLASDRLWLDDPFLAAMAELAARVRDLPPLPEGFERSCHRLGPAFFCPAFGGAYVIEEPGASTASAASWVLSAGAPENAGAPAPLSARGRRVELLPLTAEAALEVLERHRIARVDLEAWRTRPEALDRIRHWLAVDACFERDPERVPPLLGPREVAAALRPESGPSPEHLELDELARRLATRTARVDPSSLSAASRLRLAVPTTTRPAVACFVLHVQAFLDPLDLGLAWSSARDLLFARLPRLPAPRRAYLASWLASHPAALERETRA
jgi:hypothetical protein